MRLLLALFAGLACAAPLRAASASPPFSPVPLQLVHWLGENAAPQGAGLAGRWQVILVVDWTEEQGRSARQVFWNLTWELNNIAAPGWAVIGVTANDNGQGRGDGPARVVRGGDPSGGLLRAIGGDAGAILVVVRPDGEIERWVRQDAEGWKLKEELTKVIKDGAGLVENESQYAIALKPALDLARLCDPKGALQFAQKRGGADGQALVKGMGERASALIDADAAVAADPTAPAWKRFAARERIRGLLELFPTAAGAAALKAKADKDLAAEQAAWAALQQYYAEMGKLSAKKAAAYQAQQIPALMNGFPGTYAAEIAKRISLAAKLP